MISLISSVIDNAVFYLAFSATGRIAISQATGRVISVLFNYAAVRNTVFRSGQPHTIVLPRYLFLVTLNALLSYAGIRFLVSISPIPVVAAKMIAETLLFVLNYAAQKVYVFRHSGEQRLS
jgi:putative flippase GtrA